MSVVVFKLSTNIGEMNMIEKSVLVNRQVVNLLLSHGANVNCEKVGFAVLPLLAFQIFTRLVVLLRESSVH